MAVTRYNTNIVNVSKPERWITGIAGAALAIYGLARKSWSGAAIALGGAVLLRHGISGKSYLYRSLGITTTDHKKSPMASVGHGEGIKIESRVTIYKTPEELFRFWRRLENLPQFMEHLESVTTTGPLTSHWVAKAPAGKSAEWDAEIYNAIENELIAWRSIEGSEIDNAGSVRFQRAPNGEGTEVKVEVSYVPPAGLIGTAIAKLFGEEPGQQIDADLQRLKQLMETGEIPTTKGEPTGKGGRLIPSLVPSD